MEAIRDVDRHMLCAADPYRGIIEHSNRKERILIYLPVGGEITFIKENTYTVIRRNGNSRLSVNSVHISPD